MSAFAPFAASIAIKATILLGGAALLMPLLRRRSAALRHLVWSLALGGAVVLPFAAATLPVSIPLLPAPTAEAVRTPKLDVEAPVEANVPAIVDDAISQATSVEAPTRLPDATTIALFAWLTGAVLFLGRFMLGVFRLRALVRRAVPVEDPSWVEIAERTRADLPRVPLELRVSDETDMPFATGLVAPAIVLPAAAVEWSTERREAVLLHELAHLGRGDLLMNMISQVARALYWFNPLAWYAAHRLRVEGECAADDMVLGRGARASDYADHLLSIATSGSTTLPTAALAMARRSAFEGRLLAILAPNADRVAPSRARVALTAAMFALVIIPLAAASPTARAAALTPASEGEAASAQAPASVPAAPRTQTQEGQRREEPRVQQASSAVPALMEALADENSAVRLAAIESLGSLGDPRAIAALGKALREDTDSRVREAAAEALGEIDDTRALPHLVEALKAERVASVREKIVHALGEIGDASSVDAIATASKDQSVAVRRAVADALGEIDSRRALPTLLAMARDTDVEVRREVADAIGDEGNEDAYDTLVLLARDADAEVRQQAIDGLGHFEDRRALEIFIGALKDTNADVRSQAADAIHNIDDLGTAPPALIAALSDPSHDVRHNVAHALGSIGDEAAVPALKRALSDDNVEVRRSVAEALAEIGGAEAITALMALLKDADPEIRKTAAEALGKRR
jgi:HEAT repeat protein/beta-lactamase regulating signal transducer with metallopeptidase domain